MRLRHSGLTAPGTPSACKTLSLSARQVSAATVRCSTSVLATTATSCAEASSALVAPTRTASPTVDKPSPYPTGRVSVASYATPRGLTAATSCPFVTVLASFAASYCPNASPGTDFFSPTASGATSHARTRGPRIHGWSAVQPAGIVGPSPAPRAAALRPHAFTPTVEEHKLPCSGGQESST